MASVFLSYSHVDSEIADGICALLDEMQISVFRDVKNIGWGTGITGEAQKGIEEASAILVIVSPASLRSSWVPYEVGYASALRRKILPFWTHPSLDTPPYLRDLKYLTCLEDVRTSVPDALARQEAPVPDRPQSGAFSGIDDDARQTIVKQMPRLLQEMKQDVTNEETALVREFVVLPNRGVRFWHSKPRFEYYEREHEDLLLKVDRLEEAGLISSIRSGTLPIFRMTSEFVNWLERVHMAAPGG